MLDHVSIPVADLERSARFYDAVLATLGLQRRKQRPGAIGYGPEARPAPVFWILAQVEAKAATSGVGLHISFQARDREASMSSMRRRYDVAPRTPGSLA